MATIVSTVNFKGGVGKTTLSVNIAACLAQEFAQRVLLVDLDAQVNAAAVSSAFDSGKERSEVSSEG